MENKILVGRGDQEINKRTTIIVSTTKIDDTYLISCTGIDSIAADLKENKMTIIGEMDAVAIAKKLKKIGKIDIVSIGPAKEEKKGRIKKKRKKRRKRRRKRRRKKRRNDKI